MTTEMNSAESYETFKGTIEFLQTKMREGGKDITDAELANKLKIPIATYYEYLEKDSVPEVIFEILRREFKDILNGVRVKRVTFRAEIELPDPDEEDWENG